MARQKQAEVLYCSFCGKSQHDVAKLIAGPSNTVCICDECTELCDDIIWEESRHDAVMFRIKLPQNSLFDDTLCEAISQIVNERYPDLSVKYECKTRSPASISKRENDDATYAVYTFSSKDISPSSVKETKTEIESLVRDLTISNTRFMHESKKREAAERELNELKSEYLEHLRKAVSDRSKGELSLLAVMFLDVSGFSKLEMAQKQNVIDTLRGLAFPILGTFDANNINMWGDAVLAVFEDVNKAVECAVRFQRHLAVERLDTRIGMAWGEVRQKFNEALQRNDIDGYVVDFAARLESFAQPGEILVGDEFGGLNIREEVVELVPRKVIVTKPFASKSVGDEISVLQIRIKMN